MNGIPVFRNPDLFQVLPIREMLRQELPNGRNGVVLEDLDLVVRLYGPNFGLDANGRFRLLECKYGMSLMDHPQERTFRLLVAGLTETERFDGLFLVQYSNPVHTPDTVYWVTGPYAPWGKPNAFHAEMASLTRAGFLDWLKAPRSADYFE